MFKIIFLLAGLAVGFGGGVYWAHSNPEAAAKVSAEEERRIAAAKLEVTRKFREKLDQLASKSSARPSGSSGFLGSGQGGAGVSAADVSSVRDEAKREEEELAKQAGAAAK